MHNAGLAKHSNRCSMTEILPSEQNGPGLIRLCAFAMQAEGVRLLMQDPGESSQPAAAAQPQDKNSSDSLLEGPASSAGGASLAALLMPAAAMALQGGRMRWLASPPRCLPCLV